MLTITTFSQRNADTHNYCLISVWQTEQIAPYMCTVRRILLERNDVTVLRVSIIMLFFSSSSEHKRSFYAVELTRKLTLLSQNVGLAKVIVNVHIAVIMCLSSEMTQNRILCDWFALCRHCRDAELWIMSLRWEQRSTCSSVFSEDNTRHMFYNGSSPDILQKNKNKKNLYIAQYTRSLFIDNA